MKTALLALILAVSSSAFAADFADIAHKDLNTAIESKAVVIIDVNGSDSYKAGHIPTAIDFEAKEKELAKLLPADKNALIVAYCGSAQCPAWKSAATAVSKLGYTNVKHYTGGLSGWKEAGGKLQQN